MIYEPQHRTNINDSEKLSWPAAIYYNIFFAKLLAPTYEMIADNIPIQNRGVIVDVGCGPGHLAYLIARKYSNLKVIGLDISEPAIRIAKQKKLQNLEFQIGDVHNLQLKDDSTDFIVSTLSFHHWQDQIGALNEIYRVLSPSGKAFIYELYSDVSDMDINKHLTPFFRHEFFKKKVRIALSSHGYSKAEYETHISKIINESLFSKSICEKTGICIRIDLNKIHNLSS